MKTAMTNLEYLQGHYTLSLPYDHMNVIAAVQNFTIDTSNNEAFTFMNELPIDSEFEGLNDFKDLSWFEYLVGPTMQIMTFEAALGS